LGRREGAREQASATRRRTREGGRNCSEKGGLRPGGGINGRGNLQAPTGEKENSGERTHTRSDLSGTALEKQGNGRAPTQNREGEEPERKEEGAVYRTR